MIQAVCWMLIHSLWQGLIFTIVTGIVLVYTKKSAAAIRYNLLSGLFFLFMAVCALTFLREWQTSGQQSAGLYAFVSLSDNSISSWVGRLNDYLSEHASLIVLGWCIVFLFKCVRMIAGIVYTQRIRNYGVVQPPVYWREKTLRFCQQLQIKKTVRLLESKLVKMPFVTGHWKPIIFIPLGLLTKLPEGEIEAVLLHELAHIRRNDYFMNFLQHIGESIFFFNPGLLWISSLLREERENCCDDMAIDRTKDKMEFVRALISFREYDLSRTGVVVPFPAGRHQLLQRVTRIVHNKNKSLSKAEKLFFVASFCVISLLLAASIRQTGGGRDRSPSLNRTSADPVWLGSLLSFEVKVPAEELEEDWPSDVPSQSVDQPTSDNAAGSSEEAEQRERDRKEAEAQGEKDRLSAAKATGNENAETLGAVALKIQTKVAVLKEEEMHLQADVQTNGAANLQVKSQVREQSLQQAREQAQRDKFQAEKNAVQAVLDRQQADRERAQADRDRMQADQDRQQANRDRAGAIEDQRQAERDRLQAIEDRKQADRDRAQAELDRKQADRARAQAEEDRQRTTHSQH